MLFCYYIVMNTETRYAGLGSGEVVERQKQYGPNTINKKRKSIVLETIWTEMRGPMTILLSLAVVVSCVLKEYAEAIVVLVVIILNLFFTIFQVYKADNALEALKKLISEKTLVFRSGRSLSIDSKELVPGDIIYIESGAKVPADIKMLESTFTEVNEAMLTGESLPAQKKVGDGSIGELYMGTVLEVGQVYGEVIATGPSTMFGKIAESLTEIKETDTNLQKKFKDLTKKLGLAGLIGAVIVFALSFIKDKNIYESLLLTISLVVAIVPEGLPAVTTAILSIGVGQMAGLGVIMRRLDAIEGFGDITILATDKTGTLTQNKMTVEKLWVRNETHSKNITKEQALLLCFSVNVKVTEVPNIDGSAMYVGDPTEVALREYINTIATKNTIFDNIKITEEVPFSSDSRIRKTYIEIDNKKIVLINGAPETILDLDIHLMQEEREEILNELQTQASLGLRTIAYAVGENDEHIHFIGFAALKDPLRPGIRSAIDTAAEMGIRTILITGDNPLTAEAIAVEAGITTKKDAYITGDILRNLSDEKLLEIIEHVDVFARIAPDQKLRLIKILQKKGEFVAMTGDGVNDAPALKQADIGVAMGKVGTDVAKEAADAVVTDDNYVTMIDGVRAGRVIMRRTQLAVTFFIAGNIGEFLYIISALIFNLPLISPIQILFINIITDAVPALALSFAPVKVQNKTRKKGNLLGITEYSYIAVVSCILALSALYGTYIFRDSPDTAKTVAFLILMLVQQVMLVDLWLGMVRHTSELKKLLNRSIISSVTLTLLVIYTIFNIRYFVSLFDLSEIPLHIVTLLIYTFGAYLAYVFTRVHDTGKAKQ